MHVVSQAALIKFWKKHAQAEQPLRLWYSRIKNGSWKNLNDLKKDFAASDIIGNNRIVFNIKGNDYRLIAVAFVITNKIYIRFVGTHAEYNKINAHTI